MSGVMTTKQVLSRARNGHHLVHVYQDDEALAEIICHYITDQLDPSEAIVIIATQAHTQAIRSRLLNQGIDVAQMESCGQLSILDASELLARFMVNGKPDEVLFTEIMKGILGRLLAVHRSVRAYGEMVDLLWQDQQKEAAVLLEQYWNTLLKKYSFSLLCAYQLDNLDAANYSGAIECVCKTHTHFLPAQDVHQLEKAVADASKCVMGVNLSSMYKCISTLVDPSTAMPPSQASLLYLSKTMPGEMNAILHQVRSNLKG